MRMRWGEFGTWSVLRGREEADGWEREGALAASCSIPLMTTDMERRRWQPSAGERSFCNHQALHTLLCGIQVQTHYDTVAWLFLSAVTIDCPVTTPLLESLQ